MSSARVHRESSALLCSLPPARQDIRLRKNEIHIWCASLDDFREDLPRFDAVLSADERARASTFRFARDRDGYLIRRALLRELLGHYLDRRASSIELSYGRYGKPYIADMSGRPLEFTVSRSADLVVYALTSTGPIGVDVERLHTSRDLEAVAARVLSAPERDSVMALPPGERARGFLARWTCKEAVLKATGDGIGRSLNSLASVDTVPGQRARVVGVGGGESHAASGWQLHQLWPALGYVGAVAYACDRARLSLWTLSRAVLGGTRS